MGVQEMADGQTVAHRRRTAFPGVLVWCLALVPFLVLFLTRAPDAYRPDSGDYAQYLSHGRAVAEGRQYTDIGYVYTTFAARTGPEAFPPGVPVLLAAAFRIFGSTERIAELMLFPFALAFLLLGGLYFARASSLQLGIAATIVTGLSTVSSAVLATKQWQSGWESGARNPGVWQNQQLVVAIGRAPVRPCSDRSQRLPPHSDF